MSQRRVQRRRVVEIHAKVQRRVVEVHAKVQRRVVEMMAWGHRVEMVTGRHMG